MITTIIWKDETTTLPFSIYTSNYIPSYGLSSSESYGQSCGFSSSHVWKWELKKAECRRIGAFELWCWRRLLRVPWTERKSNQSILKEISPKHSLEGQMLKLKLQHFGHVMWRTDSLEKILMLGKIEGRRRKGWHHQLDGHEFEQAPGVGDGQGNLACCSPRGHKESDMTEWLNWMFISPYWRTRGSQTPKS